MSKLTSANEYLNYQKDIDTWTKIEGLKRSEKEPKVALHQGRLYVYSHKASGITERISRLSHSIMNLIRYYIFRSINLNDEKIKERLIKVEDLLDRMNMIKSIHELQNEKEAVVSEVNDSQHRLEELNTKHNLLYEKIKSLEIKAQTLFAESTQWEANLGTARECLREYQSIRPELLILRSEQMKLLQKKIQLEADIETLEAQLLKLVQGPSKA